jgi:sensor histidine kinase regulating citrate/malate metabolism
MEVSTVDNTEALKVALEFVAVINIVVALLAVFSINQVMVNARKGIEANLLKVHLANVDQLIATLQAERHEYTRHVQTVQAMLYLGEYETSKEYIDGIAEGYRQHEGLEYVGEPLLTGLINSKQVFASSMGIDFAFAFKCDPRQLPLAPWDLCSVIGNLLDNALEATSTNEDGERRVGLELKEEEAEYVIYVYNTGDRITNTGELFTPGYTTKGSEGRGYGLYIVQRLAASCSGHVEVITQPRTTFIVHLPKGVVNHDQTVECIPGPQPGTTVAI